MNALFWKPPFRPVREEALLSSMLAQHLGKQDYPGDSVPSPNWPGFAPGRFGQANAIAPIYQPDPMDLVRIKPKPPVLWVRGADDTLVSDAALGDRGTLGKMGVIPGWPGEDVFPPQPMVSQTRYVLEQFAANGGQYREVVLEATGHSPFIEKPDAFNQAFHAHLSAH
jgi:pimeloyl-ACP methyl ester carboxylesterase